MIKTPEKRKAVVVKLPLRYHAALKSMAASQHRTVTAQVMYMIEREHVNLNQHKRDPMEALRSADLSD